MGSRRRKSRGAPAATAPKSNFMRWLDRKLDRDPALRRQVEEALSEMRIEQDLAALREQRRLSQSELARILGISQPAVAKLESGRAKNLQLKTLVKWTAALGAELRIEVSSNKASRSKAATG